MKSIKQQKNDFFDKHIFTETWTIWKYVIFNIFILKAISIGRENAPKVFPTNFVWQNLIYFWFETVCISNDIIMFGKDSK